LNKFYWFGDSWLVGAELEHSGIKMDERTDYVFAKYISEHFDKEYVNCGVSGTSVNNLPFELQKYINNIDQDDIVFFGLTALHRTGVVQKTNEELIWSQILPMANYGPYVNENAKQWFKYFDTEEHRLYNYDTTITLLYLILKNLNVDCRFYNIFTTAPDSIWFDMVPEDKWLLPRDKCIADFILPINGNEFGQVVSHDQPFLKSEDWQIQQEHLQKYIKPGWTHPNPDGHKKIAEKLIPQINL